MTLVQAIIFTILSAFVLYVVVRARRAATIAADSPPTRLQMAHILGLLISGMGFFLIVMCGAIIVFSNVASDAERAAKDAKLAADNAQVALATAEAERDQRVDTVSNFLDVLCQTNNPQDLTLADLVGVSIEPQGDFGENIDPSTLTPFDLQVLATIAKLQAAQSESPLVETFRDTLEALEDLTPCSALVEDYRNGNEINVEDVLDAPRDAKPRNR